MNDFDSLKTMEPYPNWRIGSSFHFFDSVESTNDLLKLSILPKNLTEGTTFIADEQKAGKGRTGRSWDSPPGVGLWISSLFEPAFPIEEYFLINIMTSVCVYEVMQSVGLKPFLKWPNDILVGGKKICGILLESLILNERRFLIVGIGMNINTNYFSDSLQHSATSLFIETQTIWSRKTILEQFLERMNSYYPNLDASIIDVWKSKRTILGHPISIMTPNEIRMAVAKDMAKDGALVVETFGKLEKIYAADVSIRIDSKGSPAF